MNALKPVTSRKELPTVPLTLDNATGEAPLLLGRLIWHTGERRRPFVAVLVACPCGHLHRVPWRWDWGLASDVVSYQVLRCRNGARPAWIGLDPAYAEEAARVRAEAHEAFARWKADTPARHAAGKAARAAATASVTVEPLTGPSTPTPAVEKPAPVPEPTGQTQPRNGLAGRLANRRAATTIIPRNPWEAPNR